MTIRAPKDFWSGIMFLAFAAVALLTARGYAMGTAGHMGPGYFPMLLGGLLGLLGVALVARSLVIEGEGVDVIHVRPIAVMAIAVCLFGLAMERLGLVAALIVAVVVSALASRESRAVETIALAFALAVFSVLLFVYALRLPLPIWPSL
jgi:putative tricarboxylic transport membrane protein